MSGYLMVTIPPDFQPERKYAVSVVLEEFLGLSVEIQITTSITAFTGITVPSSSKTLRVADVFFSQARSQWLESDAISQVRPAQWAVGEDLPNARTVAATIPVLFGRKGQTGSWLERDSDATWLGLDVFGSAFFMLTRYEEIASPIRDEHGRFPARASLAFRGGFLDRPIIDEYVEILWANMERLWPGLERRRRTGTVQVSHDVDWPSAPRRPLSSVVKATAGDILRRRSPKTAFNRIRWGLTGNPKHDPYNTFGAVMNLSENAGIRSAFYFIAGHTGGAIDGNYDVDEPSMRKLMTEIHQRGHEIGLHPSYNTYQNAAAVQCEFNRLLVVARALGINQGVWGGRQHYLRWEAPTTWQAWEAAGLNYDATVGYADYAGFRAGTCMDYPVFNIGTRSQLKLRERPLIVMEGTLLGERYMNLSYPAALDFAMKLRSRCLALGGTFTLLWHNSHLLTTNDVRTLETLLGTGN